MEAKEIGRKLFVLLGCATKQLECNGYKDRWGAIYPNGYEFNICTETEEQAIGYAAYDLVHVDTIRYFPKGANIIIEVVNNKGRVNVNGTIYGDTYPLWNMGELVAHALLDYLEKVRVNG